MEEATSTGVAAAAAAKPMNVLVAIDDSDESFNALQWVIDKILKPAPRPTDDDDDDDDDVAQQDSNYNKVVTIAHVVEPLPARYAYPGGYVLESSNKSQQQNAARILSRAFEMCRVNSLKAKTVILEGDAKDMICRGVEEMHIDLLVIGSRGLGQIKRAFLGSVSDYCMHQAKCAVLVVKPPAKKKSS